VTNIEENIRSNQDFSMSIYPNPLSKNSMIRYELPQSGQVSLRLINIHGQQVSALNLGFQVKGVQLINMASLGVKTEGLPAGTYFMQLNLGKQQSIQKVIIQ
jgi:hypothetical protein